MKKHLKAIYLIAALAVVTALIIMAIYSSDSGAGLPEVVLPTPDPAAEQNQAQESGETPSIGDVTPETVQAAISTLARADSFIRELEFVTFWEGGSSLTELAVHARGEDFFITVKGPAGPSNILIRGENVWIWHEDKNKFYSGKTGDRAFEEADRYMRLVSYEHLLELPVQMILGAGFLSLDGEPCIFAEYLSSPELGYVSKIYISTETGLVVSEETYDENGEPAYRLTALSTDISTPADEIMSPPGQ